MKLLLVALPTSIHTVRWLTQIIDAGFDLHLFIPTENTFHDIHPDIRTFIANNKMHIIINSLLQRSFARISRTIRGNKIPIKETIFQEDQQRLVNAIKMLKPDLIHSMETQYAGYLTVAAKKIFPGSFPRWLHTNWGSDIYYFGELPNHAPKIKEVLAHCDYYSCECHRDIVLARKFGFKGKTLPVFPNTGGFHLNQVKKLQGPGPTSKRRTIVLKGYQNFAGRALIGLEALERCVDLLHGYELVMYSVRSLDVRNKIDLFTKKNRISIRIIPDNSPHEDILRMHGSARISIGLSISDAISTSFLEALVMGSFPIQSSTACADEWVKNGETALLVPPEDPIKVAEAIRNALTDDALVDTAQTQNWSTTQNSLDYALIQHMAIDSYHRIGNMQDTHDNR